MINLQKKLQLKKQKPDNGADNRSSIRDKLLVKGSLILLLAAVVMTDPL